MLAMDYMAPLFEAFVGFYHCHMSAHCSLLIAQLVQCSIIKCCNIYITPVFIVHSISLRNLASNPFNCNCHLAWFSDWLRKRGFSGANCAAPAKVRDIPIRDLPPHEFKCLSDADEGCLGEGYCPPSCTCTGTVVRCSRNKLKEIPRGIPAETSELYLESNEIQLIHQDRISHLKSLTRLYVVIFHFRLK